LRIVNDWRAKSSPPSHPIPAGGTRAGREWPGTCDRLQPGRLMHEPPARL